MSVLWTNRGHLYCPHVRPVLVDCNFIVDSTNGNGLGIRSLKGQGVQSVFMNTSAAFTGTSHTSTLIDGISSGTGSLLPGMPVQGSGIPANTVIASIVSTGSITLSNATSTSTTGSITYQGVGSPNPPAGIIAIKFTDNFNRYYGGFSGSSSVLSGSSLAVDGTNLTPNAIYVIVSVGTSTAADWLALGVPPGVTPAVGVTFIAKVSGTGSGSGFVQAPAASGANIDQFDLIGDPNTTLGPIPVGGSPNVGGWIYLRTLTSTSTSVTTLIATAPVNGSSIGMTFYLGQSSVSVAGE